MQSITVQSHIGNDGILRLQVPVGLKDVDVQVTLALEEAHQNSAAKSPEDLGWPPEFFEATYGCLKDDPVERPLQNEFEETAPAKPMTIDEIEALAQSNGWPPGFFRQTVGQWAGEPLVRPPQGEFEVRDELL